MEKAKVPGLSIAIIKDAKLFWHRGFGVKDNASKEPVDNDTVFEAASTSKPVFAYAVMKLCERGIMNLDTPLTRYTPERFLEGDVQAGPHYCPSCAFSHQWVSKLPVKKRTVENPFHTWRKVVLFR